MVLNGVSDLFLHKTYLRNALCSNRMSGYDKDSTDGDSSAGERLMAFFQKHKELAREVGEKENMREALKDGTFEEYLGDDSTED